MEAPTTVAERRTPAHVEAYMPGGYTKLLLHVGSRVSLDVPTRDLPPDARKLGSRVVVIYKLRDGELDEKGKSYVRVGIEKDKSRTLDA